MPSVTIDQFIAHLENHKARTRVALNQFVITFILACVEEVIVGGEFGPGTPVDTGFLRAMWWISINGSGSSPNLVRPTGLKPGEPGIFATEDQTAQLLDVIAGDTVELNNNTEYAAYVENGTDHTPPVAMVRSVAVASQAIALRTAAKLGWPNTGGPTIVPS